jgi:two-component system, LytTR family, response regulator
MSQPTTTRVTAIIADDESLARSYLREMLLAYPEIEVVGECANGLSAVEMVQEKRPGLLFLDIQMPKLDGFEVLQALEADPPRVIFVTAYNKYALKAFEFHAVDYLLKPFPKARLESALERVLSDTAPSLPRGLGITGAAERSGNVLMRIVVKDGDKVRVIATNEIECITAEGDYVAIHTGGETLLKLQTLASMEKVLDPVRFVRIHRSAIVNLEALGQVVNVTKDAREAVLKSGRTLPVSRGGYRALRDRLGE